jgi:hypothetical protein
MNGRRSSGDADEAKKDLAARNFPAFCILQGRLRGRLQWPRPAAGRIASHAGGTPRRRMAAGPQHLDAGIQ